MNDFKWQEIILGMMLITAAISCANFTGPQGIPGPAGPSGTPGASCAVQTVTPSPDFPDGGALVLCGQSSTFITNGSDGVSSTGLSISAVLNPCGVNGANDEVFLQLSDGRVIASFSDNSSGKNTRFSVLTPGSYSTTDGYGCNFTMNGDGSLSN